MVRNGLLGCALHLFSTASSLVLRLPQVLPEITAHTPIALDPYFNSSAIQIVPIPTENTQSDLTSSLSLANITAPADNATLTQVDIDCNGAPFTRSGPTSYASCQDAYGYILGSSDMITFGDRASGDWNANLPLMFMSGDGLCVIEIDVAEHGQVDRSTPNAMQLAAHAILGVCMQRHNRVGEATGLGQRGRLTVTVRQNLPTVQCTPSDKPPVGAMCEHILEEMPAFKGQQVFGNRGTAGIDVPIPWTMATPDMQCVIKAQMIAGLTAGPSLRTSWYKIWEQAVALTVLCANVDKDGQVYIYDGGQPRMTISISNEARQSLAIGVPDNTSQ